MKAKLIMILVETLLSMLTPTLIRQLIDSMLNFAEEYVLGTESIVDDKVVLPICKMLRAIVNTDGE